MVVFFSIIKGVILGLYHTFKKPVFFAAFIALIMFLLTPVFIYFYFAQDLASKESIVGSNSKGISLYDREDRLFFNFYEAKTKLPVTLSEVPVHLQQAIIAVEDKDFYEHEGFSIPAIIRAFYTNLRSREILYGASTITQQLVKNTLLTPKKSFLRKYQEIILAFEIERLYTKNEILEMYLNTVYLGEGATGAGTASKVYFSKDIKDLTLAESALLAGILPAPSHYSPITGDIKKTLGLQRRVLGKMIEKGYISSSDKEAAEKQTIYLSPQKKEVNVKAAHFALLVRDQLLKNYTEQELANSGFKITTTIDLDMQDIAQSVVKEQVLRLSGNRAGNGAVIVLDPKTSEVLVMIGSMDWYNNEFGKFNMAIAPRQSGSAFKPIIYAKAFEDRVITPATILKDAPTTFEYGYKPKNYDGRFRGNLFPRRALANSINVPAVEVMSKVGVENGVDFAKKLGVDSLKEASNYGLSLVLGTGEIPLLELTNAYGVFANNGTFNAPTIITKIENKVGETIFSNRPSPQKVLDEDVAFLISSILSDNNARREVFGNALTIDRPAAVKTGTTEFYKDALTVGYTPSLVVGIWVGNNDNRPMDNVAGSLGAAPIWRILMTEFSRNKPIERFNPPASVITASICAKGGQVAQIASTSANIEYFLQGSELNGFCDISSTSPTPTIAPSESPTVTPVPTSAPTPTSTPNPTPTPTLTPTPTSTPTLIPLPTLTINP